MATKAGTRHKRTIATRDELPKTLADKWELIVPIVGKKLFDVRATMRQAMGAKPYKNLPVDEAEETKRWNEVRHDADEALRLFEDNVKHKPDGTVLLPKSLVEAIIRQEKARTQRGND
jgi:short-subunit dehydrogenase involved in D-alanine esterification of teichoic acids